MTVTTTTHRTLGVMHLSLLVLCISYLTLKQNRLDIIFMSTLSQRGYFTKGDTITVRCRIRFKPWQSHSGFKLTL